MPFSPLTLTLSPKGRGKINFNNTFPVERGRGMDRGNFKYVWLELKNGR